MDMFYRASLELCAPGANDPTPLPAEDGPVSSRSEPLSEGQATANERLSGDSGGVERFWAFDERIPKFDRKLLAFSNAVRQLGSSAGLLSAVTLLRTRLTKIQSFFRENAAELFDDISHASKLGIKSSGVRKRAKVQRLSWVADIENLPQELEGLAEDLVRFLSRLNDLSEFRDEAVNASIEAFEVDLKYVAKCLRGYKGQFKSVTVAQYINELTEVAVPQIRLSEERDSAGLLNLSAVATFFSGVTATTLQGLVFSIGSAINSQLAYHWRTAVYRSPQCHVPWWAAIWITHTPLIFLGLSVIAFSIGLCVFTYSSGQSPAVAVVVMSSVGVTTFALLCVGLWVALERWVFAKTKGTAWMWDILAWDMCSECRDTGGIIAECGALSAKDVAFAGLRHTLKLVNGFLRSFVDTARAVAGVALRMTEAVTSMLYILPVVFIQLPVVFFQLPGAVPSPEIPTHRMSRDNREVTESHNSTMPKDAPMATPNVGNESGNQDLSKNEKQKLSDLGNDINSTIPENKPMHFGDISPPLATSSSSAEISSKTTELDATSNAAKAEPAELVVGKNARFQTAARRAAKMSRDSPAAVRSQSCRRQDSSDQQLNPARMQGCISMLHALRSSQMVGEQASLVKHLQFSPDGQFLATCSQNRTAHILRVGSGTSDDFTVLHTLAHTSRTGGFVEQVAWSPSGDRLLTKQPMIIKVWDTRTGVCTKTIDRKRSIRSISWMPTGLGFVSVEWRFNLNSGEAKKRVIHVGDFQGSELVIIGVDGTVLDTHDFPHLQFREAAVTPNEERVVVVASLVSSVGDLKPMKSRNEKRIIVYNLQTRVVESQVPLLQEVRDVTLTGKGNYALVSYENKTPPQVWRLEMIAQKCQLVHAHTYLTKVNK
ncbi:hypothetical protein BDV93DRAFT_564446 [Ceratobasidium sp. AG-I]|nr:hypothetical protein BDV93DRAFT_564446 [Ceratobasidium sp. AG-I]